MLFFVVLLSLFGRAVSLECYICSGSINLEECMSTVTCHDGQVCYKKLTYLGQMVYDLGCSDKQTCGGYASRPNAEEVLKISSDATHNCHECCSTDNCNMKICEYKHSSLCVDDKSVDCALLNSLFNICMVINQAKKLCPKYCDLCDVVDGNWSPWSDWSQCDVTCENGTLARKLSCSNPAPKHGGLDCQGNAVEKIPCYREVCPDGGWSDWQPWSNCSADCDGGFRKRFRTCSNPKPSHLGNYCSGSPLEIVSCETICDGGWADWHTWSNCDGEECGTGFRQRSRTCSNPRPSSLGQYCFGNPIEISFCDTICHGGWSDWQTWSRCIGDNCGSGFRTRSRTCSNPIPSEFGNYCPGNSNETVSCKTVCPSDCYDIYKYETFPKNGIYNVQLWKTKRNIQIYCDMETDNGGWTVFQYRFDGTVIFYRNFSEYDKGFGDLNEEFWLGLSYIQEIASQGRTDLRIDLEALDGKKGYETFTSFNLSAGPDYTLHVGKTIASLRTSGNIVKSFRQNHNGRKFSTYDHDVDSWGHNCAMIFRGGWWYSACYAANLNGLYMKPGKSDAKAMVYEIFSGFSSLKSSKMMIRRI